MRRMWVIRLSKCLLGMLMVAAAESKAAEAAGDWCKVESPAVATPGVPLEVTVTMQGAEGQGLKLAVDLHWMKKNGTFGGVLGYVPRKDAIEGKSQTFRFKFAAKEEMGSVMPVVFLSPDGNWQSKTKLFKAPLIPLGVATAGDAKAGETKPTDATRGAAKGDAGKSAVPSADATAAATPPVSQDADWVTIETPGVAVANNAFDVKVTVKDPGDAAKLAVDLYWMKSSGQFGGLLVYGPRRAAAKGTQTFKFTVKPKDGAGTVYATAFLSPDGRWESKIRAASSPKVKYVTHGSPAGEAALVTASPAGVELAKADRPASATFKRSWIWVHPPEREVAEGEAFEVRVDYYLDSADTWGGKTRLSLSAHGPWIDNPDGKYSTERKHVGYPGIGGQATEVAPGKGTHTFQFKASKLYRHNSLLLIASFKDSSGKDWPWNVRASGPRLKKIEKNFTLRTTQPGNLFTYAQEPRAQIVFGEGAVKGEQKTLRYSIINVRGEETKSEYSFASGAPGEYAEFPLILKERGLFVLEGEVEGWGKREMVLGTIPDVPALTGDRPTIFGATNVDSDTESRIARRLGLSWVRHFTSWKALQPAPDVWKLERLDRVLETNRASGLKPWICLIDPPAWALSDKARNIRFAPYGFDAASLAASVRAMSERWKGVIWGWEWQNEIVPGSDVADPVSNYIEFCRVGTEAAKAVAPSLQTQMAGGLWPRNFRSDLLKRGIAKHLDVIPVHYSNFDGVRDAQEDLAAIGSAKGRVWDNESGSGLSVWGMPLQEMVQVKSQSKWVLEKWPDELVAGAEQITYFGGQGDPAGNWSYLIDEQTPRPLAVTLAVLTSKLGHAQPIGKFFVTGGSVVYVFAKDGKSILVMAPTGGDGKVSDLQVGVQQVVVTDYQGNEVVVPAPDGRLTLALGDLPVFVEGGDLETLKSYLVLSVGTATRPKPMVQLTAVQGSQLEVPLQIENPYGRSIQAEITLQPEGAAEAAARVSVNLAAGARQVVQPTVAAALNTSGRWIATVKCAGLKAPAVQTPFHVTCVNASMLGNLLRNGGFETAGREATQAAEWSTGKGVERVAGSGGLGLGSSVLRFGGSGGWLRASQNLSLPESQSYLYTAWARTSDVKQGGSNITYALADGKKKELYIPHVFQVPASSLSWRLLSYRGATPTGTQQVAFTPLAQAGGWMLMDNLRVTLYEGSNFAAEARKAEAAPKIDGNLAEWRKEEPIPLLCDNQLSSFMPGYKWTPENLSGVAYLQWDQQALYLAVEVVDDQLATPATGDRTPESDSVTIALQPSRLGKESNGKAFAYYLSAASPGGGSGKTTLYRPAVLSGGLPAGQLAKDSSVYDVAILREGSRTIYEARFPWSELGGVQPRLGTKLGLSLRLDDNDGEGRAAAMTWGEGVEPAWEPSIFGILTLVD